MPSVRWFLAAASDVPSSPILVTLMKEALGSSETSVLIRATRRNILEDTILHSHRRENLKSYMVFAHITKLRQDQIKYNTQNHTFFFFFFFLLQLGSHARKFSYLILTQRNLRTAGELG
jgi:hypothetical protein